MTTHLEASRKRYERLQAELAEKRLRQAARAKRPTKNKPGGKGFARTLKYTYRLSLDEYMAQVVRQEGKCLLCGKVSKRLVVDHDPEMKALRGLLCGRCNSGLGMLLDSPELLRRAADYIEYYRSMPAGGPKTQTEPGIGYIEVA